MVQLPPEHRCRTGGGGSVVEVLVALATVASAALAALVVARPDDAETSETESAPPGDAGADDSPRAR